MLTMKRATLVGLALMAVPVALHAQRGMGPRQGGGMGNPIAPLIEMRRDLNLTSRQLVQLDSIERALLERNRTVRERMRAGMDSVRPRMRGEITEDQRQAMRARADSMRNHRQQVMRNDSSARAAAMRVLSDSQRTRVQLRQAEQRGFMRGRAAGARGQRGFRQGGRGGAGMRGRMQPMNPRPGMRPGGMRPRVGPPAGGMGFGPRFQNRRPLGDDQVGPMGRGFRRMGPPDGVGPADDAAMAPRRRRMMGDVAPGEPLPPVRRPPADSDR